MIVPEPMNQLVLWLNMVSFALMVASVGLLYLVHVRTPRPWLLAFALYTASYASWLLFGTYAYVQALFFPQAGDNLVMVFAYVRLAASFLVLAAGSWFYLGVAVQPWQPRAHLVTAAAAVVIGISMVAVLAFGVVWAGAAATALFNAYFCGLSGFALRRVARGRDARRRLAPFLWFSLVAYGVLTVMSVVLPLVPPGAFSGIPVNVLATGVFTIMWGAVTLGIAMRWIAVRSAGTEGEVPQAFLTDFGISPRERDIVDAARSGATSKEIGERLFISQRTVEAHLNNVYRKCDVTNRVELLNLLSRYSVSS